jgi:ribosome maturation factor RimP
VLRDQLAALLQPVIRDLGLDLWELEYGTRQGGALLRIYIDRPWQGTESASEAATSDLESESGITVEDCARVSHAVSEVLDKEDPVAGEYTLEVSSPGLDRVLRTLAHFERFVGSQARVEMRAPVGGRKRFQGRVLKVADGNILLDAGADGGQVTLAVNGVHKARLVPRL